MKKITQIAMTLMAMFIVLSFAPVVSAQTNAGGGVQGGLNTIGGAFPVGAQDESFANVVKVVITWALYLAAVISVLIIIYGGFLYITSAGDAAQSKKGKTALTNAIIGLVIAILAYVIVQVVYNTLIKL